MFAPAISKSRIVCSPHHNFFPMEELRVLEVTTTPQDFAALTSGKKRHHTLIRFVGAPEVGDPIRIAESTEGGTQSGRACYARVLHVERVSAEIVVLSVEVRMSTDRMPAVRE